jgi:hypothetical protein
MKRNSKSPAGQAARTGRPGLRGSGRRLALWVKLGALG